MSARHTCVIALFVSVAGGLTLSRAAHGGEASQLRLDGWGPVSVGMTSAQLEAAAGDRILYELSDDIPDCTYRAGRGDWEGLSFMMIRGRVARVDIESPAFLAESGARIGTTEEELRRIYGPRLEVKPHEYVDGGHYLTLRAPRSGKKRRMAIRFETGENGNVTKFYAGLWKYVQLVEGCT